MDLPGLLPSDRLLRGTLLDFVADPFLVPEAEAVRYLVDGLLVIRDGHVLATSPYPDLADQLGHRPVLDYSGKLILPGLIDTHIQ